MNPSVVILAATSIWFAVIISPGPNFLIVSRLAVARSRASAIGATLGIAVGSVFYAALTLFGVSVLILQFAWLGDAVRILGGAYLIWLGIQAWRSGTEEPGLDGQMAAPAGPWWAGGFRMGLLTEITNPKAITFFLGLFAATIPATTPLWAKLAVLVIGITMEALWYTLVAFVLSSGPVRRGYQQVRRAIDRVVGTLLIAVGLKLALDQR